MKDHTQVSRRTSSPPAADKSRRRYAILIGAILALVALAFALTHRPSGARPSTRSAPASAEKKNGTFKRVAGPPPVAPPAAADGGQTISAPVPVAVAAVPAGAAPPAAESVSREASPQTRQLIASLAQLDLKQGISSEQAAAWKRNLKELAAQGADGVAGIREFLGRNQDYDFSAARGGKELGHASLRRAMLDTLQQIGGPEAIDALVQTLRTTADPVEIALLARALEQQAPGQFLPLALDAAREALAMAGKGQLARVDVAPLFELLQKYGGPGAVADLEKAASQWNYYATIALADMREGAGIPALIQMVQDPKAATLGSSHVAFRLLAQLSREFPDAQNALVEQVRQNRIPESAWPELALALQGYRLEYLQSVLPDANVSRTATISQTHGVSFGNQRFATTSTLASLTPAQVQQQVRIIDQLLAATAAPAGRQALEGARANLASRLPSPGQ